MLTQLVNLKRPAKIALMVATDAIALPLCFLIALALRLGTFDVLHIKWAVFALLMTVLALVFYVRAGLYGAVIRFIELRVVLTIGLGLGFVVMAAYLVMLFLGQRGIPRTSLAIFWLAAFAYLTISRFAARSLLRRISGGSGRIRQKTLIYGAGAAGVQLVQAMQHSHEYDAMCFADDDKALWGKSVAGLPVLSPKEIVGAIDRYRISMIIVALPSAPLSRRSQVISALEHYSIPVRVLPGLTGLVEGGSAISAIRDVELADLLGRDPVPPRPDLFSRCIADKNVMVTGAGGSIGSELCRQILSQRPRRLILLDHAEFNLYAIEAELRRVCGDVELIPVVGSIMSKSLMQHLIKRHGIETIYHAAAYKHVPIVEANPLQGVENNIIGSLQIAETAGLAGVQSCILVSTDKAVRPTNVMGCTKRVAELVFQAAADRFPNTCFSMVRFGNVLGSSGSVVPLFKKQIAEGGPLTLTHSDITRYFMLIPEAAQLVIQAGAMAKGGDVFVLDMGEPVRIIDLARKMIHLSGFTERTLDHPDGDIEIRIVGLRPGEKLYEELLIGDNAEGSEHPKIMCALERKLEWAQLLSLIKELRDACTAFDEVRTLTTLQELVPEYCSPEHAESSALDILV